MKQSLRILHIEDSNEDSELVGNLLKRAGLACETRRIDTRSELFDVLQSEPFDLILADCKLPGFSGLQALEIAHALKPELPFIFVSGTIGEETAIESLRNGATDYVLKDQLVRLAPAVRRAMAEAEERELCHELQQRLHQARRIEAISTLSNGIAHDFNNILTIILGHASLLAAECHRPERVLELTGTITQAAQRASEIVQQLLAFARKSEGHLTPVDLNRFLRDNLPGLKTRVPLSIEIFFDAGEDLPKILADSSQIEVILVNLLANAVESMPRGGRLTLSTRLVPAPQLPGLASGNEQGHFVCLQVADTGVGMDEMTRDHVFEPFYTTKERGHATGLGLPVVYGLMQAQHGLSSVDSEPGKGTTVSLFFAPAKPAPVPAQPVATQPEAGLRGSETILVIEDEADIGFFLETILANQGYQVLVAHDCHEAQKLFSENRDRIALVFSDIGLPKIDGISLCGNFKREKPDLPVILASGYSPREFKDRLGELAPEAFLTKPYRTADILHTLRKVLDGRVNAPVAQT